MATVADDVFVAMLGASNLLDVAADCLAKAAVALREAHDAAQAGGVRGVHLLDELDHTLRAMSQVGHAQKRMGRQSDKLLE